MMVFSEMRPPVASIKGASPLRNRETSKIVDLTDADYMEMNTTKKQIVESITSDGKVKDPNWNFRHHVTASGFNRQNHPQYKVSRNLYKLSSSKLCIWCSNSSIKTLRIGRARSCRPRGSWIRMKRTR